jgi:TRAP-type transport system periplasmic protein
MKAKKWLKTVSLVGFCFLFLISFSISSALAAKTIRVATVALPATTIYQGLVKWQSLLKDKSGGKLEVKILGRGVMGGDREMIQACRMGTLESAVVSGSVLSNIVPQFFMPAMPYLFRNSAEANAYLNGPMGQKLFKLLEPKGLVGLGWATWSFRGIWNNVRPITKPADLKGLKIRTVQTTLDMSIINDMGAIATPMAWNECLLGMRQGTVDGISTTYGLGYPLKLYELAKYASRTKQYYETAPLIMSKKMFDKFTPQEQALIKKSAFQAMLWARQKQARLDDQEKPLLEAKGVKVNSLSPQAFAEFKHLTKPVYKEFRSKIGAQFMDESLAFLDNLRKSGAAK